MKTLLSNKLFSTLAAATLLLSAGVVNAHTISIVNANGADATPTDIAIGTDDVSNLFSMDINVVLDAGITAGLSRSIITWDPTVLMLNGFTSPLSQSPSTPDTLPNNTGSFSLQILDLDFTQTPFPAPNGNMTGAFTWATLNFSYVGPGNATITVDPVLAAGSGDGWLVTGSSTDIDFANATATVSAVPVPPAMILFTSALAALGFSSRRKLSA